MNKIKTVLIVSYYFPPYANVSVIRTTKFCKYLPEYGWKPWVFTVDPRYYQGRVIDEVLKEVTDMGVFRLPYLSFPGNTLLLKLMFPLLVFGFVCRYRKQLHAVYLSGSPFYPFPLSSLLNGLLEVPTILDFRDSWSINYGYDGRQAQGYLVRIRQWFYGLLEKMAIRFASTVVFASSVLQDEYTHLFPSYRDKYHTITNGYDPDDFAGIQPKYLVEKKTLILAGQFHIYTPEAVNYVLQGLKTLPSLHFVYVGGEHEILLNAAIANDVEVQVTVLPYQPYREVLNLLAGADYALVTTGLPNAMGTKIFDYLALSKPTLCLVPQNSMITRQFGELASILICEPPYSADVIQQALERLVAIEVSTTDKAGLASFSRQETAGKLAQLFDQAVCR